MKKILVLFFVFLSCHFAGAQGSCKGPTTGTQSTSCTGSTQLSGCSGFLTYTQGGWGAKPNGNNPATYLQNNFAAAFPSGLTIGCNNKIVFTNAAAIMAFLPSGSTPTTLPAGTMTNPSGYSNVLAGQLVAATLSMQFDLANASFAPSSQNLRDLKISSGTFFNWSVGDVIAEANRYIGGCGSAFSAADLNTILTAINQSYDNGTMAGSLLICPIQDNVQVTNVSCYGGNNGAITVTNVSGAAGAPFTYRWSTGATTPSLSNLTAGVYTLTITDRIGITKVQSFTVTQPTKVVASANATAILCKGGTSKVTVSAVGGTGAYTGTGTFTVTAGTYSYTVTDANGCPATTSVTVTEPTKLNATSQASAILCHGGNSTVTVSGNGGTAPYSGTGTFTVKAGTYNYTVTDANGCSATTSVTVTEPTQMIASSLVTTPVLCHGGNATVTVSGNGGTAPYSGTGTFTVKAGTYNYTVTDANGCSATTSVTVTEPTQLIASSLVTTPVLCHGGNATVTVSGNGGTAPYSGTGTFTVKAGTYNYTVTDANGCSATTSVTVTEPTQLIASSLVTTPVLCHGGNATVTVSGNGGTAPYSGTGTFTVKAGTYNYTVTDANGCYATTSVTVTEPTQLIASSSVTTTVLCHGGNATVTVSGNGGTAPYNGTGTFTVTAGTYNYTVTDANGCSATTSVTVTEPTQLIASSLVTTAVLCHGGNATVTVSGNGGTAPYNGTGTFTVTAGTYNYTVTDANGCSATTSVTVTEPTAVNLNGNMVPANCSNTCAGVVSIGVSGGVAPYHYSWTNNSSDSASAKLCTGDSIMVVVVDALGCRTNYNFGAMTCINDQCAPLKTFTIGGWGTAAAGNNPGVYRDAHFAAAFPQGLTVGSTYTLKLSSSAAVQAFLPSGGSPRALTGNLTDPTSSSYKNTFASQLIAATLSVTFDQTDANFAAPAHHLADMYCNFAPFTGMTVAQVITEANKALGGQTSAFSITDLNNALTLINQNYDNGTVDVGNLTCTAPNPTRMMSGIGSTSSSSASADLAPQVTTFRQYPNPVSSKLNIEINAAHGGNAEIIITDMLGRTIYESNYTATEGMNLISISRERISAGGSNAFLTIRYADEVYHSGLLLFTDQK